MNLNPKTDLKKSAFCETIIDKKINKITQKIIIIPPIVGVQDFLEWILANSLALPISHSERIFFQILYLIKSLIPYGIMNNASKKAVINNVNKKTISDIKIFIIFKL